MPRRRNATHNRAQELPRSSASKERSYVAALFALACRGYIVVSQDVRGTGQSEPDTWDYDIFEPEDGYDCVEWVSRQSWFDGSIGSFGASYVGQTQWHMALHPKMTTIVPSVSGLGLGRSTARLHMFLNADAKTVGKGDDKLDLTYTDLERPPRSRSTAAAIR